MRKVKQTASKSNMHLICGTRAALSSHRARAIYPHAILCSAAVHLAAIVCGHFVFINKRIMQINQLNCTWTAPTWSRILQFYYLWPGRSGWSVSDFERNGANRWPLLVYGWRRRKLFNGVAPSPPQTQSPIAEGCECRRKSVCWNTVKLHRFLVDEQME